MSGNVLTRKGIANMKVTSAMILRRANMTGSHQGSMGTEDVVLQVNAFLSRAVHTPNTVEEGNEGVSERVSRVLIEFGDISLRVAKHVDRRTASQLIGLLAYKSFDLNSLKGYIKSPADFEDLSTTNTRRLMSYDGFRTVLVRGGSGKNDDSRRLNASDMTSVLRKPFLAER